MWTKRANSRSRSNDQEDTPESAYERAVRFLAARPRSIAEVRRRLRKAGVDDLGVDEALARLERVGLLDDTQFAAFWVEQRLTFRPRGPRALSFELRTKGVSRDAMEPALESAKTEQREAACRAGLREARRQRGTAEPQFSTLLTRYLVRRGFDFSVTRAAVRDLAAAVAAEHRNS